MHGNKVLSVYEAPFLCPGLCAKNSSNAHVVLCLKLLEITNSMFFLKKNSNEKFNLHARTGVMLKKKFTENERTLILLGNREMFP